MCISLEWTELECSHLIESPDKYHEIFSILASLAAYYRVLMDVLVLEAFLVEGSQWESDLCVCSHNP